MLPYYVEQSIVDRVFQHILLCTCLLLTRSIMCRGKWGNAGQGVITDNAVVAYRAMVAIFHYHVAIAT